MIQQYLMTFGVFTCYLVLRWILLLFLYIHMTVMVMTVGKTSLLLIKFTLSVITFRSVLESGYKLFMLNWIDAQRPNAGR